MVISAIDQNEATLNTKPMPDLGTILVTGASGYIGGRLVPFLLERGYKVRIMVRSYSPELHDRWPEVEIVVADALKKDSLIKALKNVYAAYYLIHSLHLGEKEFEIVDLEAAINFRDVSEEMDVKRIIYLGGLGDTSEKLSKHLLSRMEVAQELIKGKVDVTVLRAAVIIGSGSASYEIIKDLARKLPVLFLPKWANNLCQPISIRDVRKYLVGVLETPETSKMHFDIGGREVLTYREMIEKLMAILGKNVRIFPSIIHSTRVYGYAASLVTPVPAKLVRALFQGLSNDIICMNDNIRKYVSFKSLSYEEAIKAAILREEADRVETRWSDSYPQDHCYALKLHEMPFRPKFTAYFSLVTGKSSESLFKSICKVGGKEGWFYNNWMWRLRGIIDRALLGVGHSRGRKSYSRLSINDVIGFWRVEDIQKNKRLLLRAEMKLPGKAWLEFKLSAIGVRTELSLIPYYETSSLFGKLYWYLFLPFHKFIFTNLIKQIERKS